MEEANLYGNYLWGQTNDPYGISLRGSGGYSNPSQLGGNTFKVDTPAAASDFSWVGNSAPAKAGWMDKLGGLSGLAALGGSAAQLYGAIENANTNRKLVKEQKKMNRAYLDEANYMRGQRQKMQDNINSVYGV